MNFALKTKVCKEETKQNTLFLYKWSILKRIYLGIDFTTADFNNWQSLQNEQEKKIYFLLDSHFKLKTDRQIIRV